MGMLFNADEVYAMAIQMEHNGAAFYRKAAALQAGGETIETFNQLAAMEDGHKATFEAMRTATQDAAADTDLYKEGGLYLAAIADGHRVEGSPAVAASLTGSESVEDIVKIAIGLEKEAILFYLGIKDVVADDKGREQLDFIIGEEKKHVVALTEELKKLQAPA